MLVVGLPALGMSGARGATVGAPATHSLAVGSHHASVVPHEVASRPLVPKPSAGLTGTFYQNTSVGTIPGSQDFCAYYYLTYGYCYGQVQDPSAVTLANGHIGLGYSVLTKYSTNNCTNASGNNAAAGNTTINVMWASSSNNGTTFSSGTPLGNVTCPWINNLEPSFAVGGQGVIYGTFVEANATVSQMTQYGYYDPINSYTTRTSDALGFVKSTNNGTSFANVTTLSIAGIGNIAKPVLASFGNTVYIAYDNISNGSTVPGTNSNGIAIEFIYSADGGATWHGPYNLPGLNATAFYNAMAPSIAVSSTGEVVVAYDTNFSCIAWCGAGYSTNGESIVISTSMTNGTSWVGPITVTKTDGVGVSGYFNSNYWIYLSNSLFEQTPQTTVAVDQSNGNIYVGWAGGGNRSLACTYTYCWQQEWWSTQVWAAGTSNGGATWSISMLSNPLDPSMNTYVEGNFNPGIGVAPSGDVYLTFTFQNSSYGSCGAASSYYNPAFSQWNTVSTNGAITWGDRVESTVQKNAYGYSNDEGHLATITFTQGTGNPVIAYSIATMWSYSTGFNFQYNQLVQVATLWSGPVVNFTGIESNVTGGASWGFAIDGNTFSTTATQESVLNVPAFTPIVVSPLPFGGSTGYGVIVQGVESGSQVPILTSNTTYWFNYSTFYGLSLTIDPINLNYFDIYYNNYTTGTNLYHYWNTYGGVTTQGGCAFLWYFPRGTHLVFQYGGSTAYYYPAQSINFWNGTGNGSFTGPGGVGDIWMWGQINETMWAQSYGVYNISVAPIGLPSTSMYNFTWDQTTYSTLAPGATIVPGVSSGPHWISNIHANSSTPGWEYFGRSDMGNPVAIPDQPNVNLSFALVDVAGPMGTVTFQANGLTAGSVWHLTFNGTEYGSNTPWINVTTHAGTFDLEAFPVTALNASVGYTPNAPNSLAVTPGSTYLINYTSAFSLNVLASSGGHLSPAAGQFWVAPGTTQTFQAIANTNFLFIGWTGTGLGSYTGTNNNATVTVNGPIEETANFQPLAPNRFNMTFVQSTIPVGTLWTVFLGGVGYSSTGANLTIPNVYSCTYSGALGRYTLFVPIAYVNASGGASLQRYAPSTYPGQVCGNTVQALSFTLQNYLTLSTTAGGTISATVGTATFTASTWVPWTSTVSLQATPNTGFTFLGWNGTGPGNYTGVQNPSPILSMGGPVTEIAAFAPIYTPPPMRYFVDFHVVLAFQSGTIWSLTFGGTTYSSSTSDLVVNNLLAGSYPLTVLGTQAPDGLTQYSPVGAPAHVVVAANITNEPLTYKSVFKVSINVVGLGVAKPSSGWYAPGSQLALNATPNGDWLFANWSGTGAGAYTGLDAQHQITVNGPITEVATFIPPAPAAKTITSSWTSTTLIGGLAVAGIAIGLIVGLVVARMRESGGSPPPSDAGSQGGGQ